MPAPFRKKDLQVRSPCLGKRRRAVEALTQLMVCSRMSQRNNALTVCDGYFGILELPPYTWLLRGCPLQTETGRKSKCAVGEGDSAFKRWWTWRRIHSAYLWLLDRNKTHSQLWRRRLTTFICWFVSPAHRKAVGWCHAKKCPSKGSWSSVDLLWRQTSHPKRTIRKYAVFQHNRINVTILLWFGHSITYTQVFLISLKPC